MVDETGQDPTPNVKEVTIGPSGRVTMNFFIGQGERNTTSFIDQLVERLVNGLNFGLMLGLAAIGLSLVFGTTGLSNFAHAEMVTFGALMAFLFGVTLSLPIWLAILIAIVLSAVFGFVMDVGLWRPLRRKGVGVVQLMIVSIGLSLALRYVFQYFIGGGTEQLPGAGAPRIQIIGPIKLSVIDMFSMGIALVVIIAFAIWLTYTRLGKATPRGLRQPVARRILRDRRRPGGTRGVDHRRDARRSGRHPLGLLPPRHPLGHGGADPAPHLRRGHPRRARHGTRRARRIPGRRPPRRGLEPLDTR